MANLMAANLSGGDLDPVLIAHLDSLAISPQVKQAIFPALLGIAKLTETHVQKCVQHIRHFLSARFFLIASSLLQCRSAADGNGAARPQYRGCNRIL